MDFSKLSIKSYIGDFPRIINGNFEIIANVLNKLLEGNTNNGLDINAQTGNFTTVKTNTINVSNDVFLNINGKSTSLITILKDKGLID